MLKIGLTGSIAVGKSFACQVFCELGVPVLDADLTAREVVEPNTKGYLQIIESFGNDILQPNGEINRAKLGAIVFSDEAKRNLLNSIIHPLVFTSQDLWLQQLEAKNINKFAIIDAALMIESGSYKRFDKIIIVWCEPKVQLERLIKRNNLIVEDAKKRINVQMPQDEKKLFADYLINTTDGFDLTRKQVLEIYRQLSVS
jgi:dephospho-CoA kinase